MSDSASRRAVTPIGLFSFVTLDKPRAMPGSENPVPKYSITVVFDPAAQKTEEFKNLQRAVMAAAVAKFGEKGPDLLRAGKLKSPFRRDPDDIKKYGYPEGSVYINARSDTQPQVINASKEEVTDLVNGIFSGCFGRISVQAFGYDKSVNKGVSFGLGNVQKVREGPRLDGRRKAEDEFDVDLSAAPEEGLDDWMK